MCVCVYVVEFKLRLKIVKVGHCAFRVECASCRLCINALHRACVCKVEVDCLRHTIIYFIVKLILSSSVLYFSCVSCDIRKCLWRAQQALTKCVVLWCMQVGACSGGCIFLAKGIRADRVAACSLLAYR